MTHCQAGILELISPFSIYLELDANTAKTTQIIATLKRIASIADGSTIVMGIGAPVIASLDVTIPGLRPFQPLADPTGNEIVPATQAGLFLQIRGQGLDHILKIEKELLIVVTEAFKVVRRKQAFRFAGGRDLTGYEDGTENPKGEDAVAAASMAIGKPGLDGSSIAALQEWVHDLKFFRALDADEQDGIFGRRIMDNSEISDGPPAAHAKRTEQESFSPEAFILRRSMMWIDDDDEGIMFTSYSSEPRPFDVQMQRMVGMEDAIVDNLFKYSTPVSGAFYWCPPVRDNLIDLRALDGGQ